MDNFINFNNIKNNNCEITERLSMSEVEYAHNRLIQCMGHNPFPSGRAVFFASDEMSVFAEITNKDNVISGVLSSKLDYLQWERNQAEINNRNRNSNSHSICSIGGEFGNSTNVQFLYAYGLGPCIEDSLTFPRYKDGQVYFYHLRNCNIDVNFIDSGREGHSVFQNVGVPSTIFAIRCTNVSKVAEEGSINDNNIIRGLQIQDIYVACTDKPLRISSVSDLRHYPFSNVSSSSKGHVCLGSYRSSEYLFYRDPEHLADFPIDFHMRLVSSHDYQGNFKSFPGTPLKAFLSSLKDKEFPDNELKPMGLDLKAWRNMVLRQFSGMNNINI